MPAGLFVLAEALDNKDVKPKLTEPLLFTGSYLDKAQSRRADPHFLAAALTNPATRFVLQYRAMSLVERRPTLRARRLPLSTLELNGIDSSRAVFLGLEDDAPLFALALQEPDSERFDPDDWADLWREAKRLPEADAGILAYAKAILEWHARHSYCPRTGAPTESTKGGHELINAKGQRLFPRVDPAIIVLVHRDQHCLLGRQATWPEGNFSTIAGFVEPGESLEDAVAREVWEETNVVVERVDYFSSQPWPFPSSLMLGFHATAKSTDIQYNDGELAEARWFHFSELAKSTPTLPPPASISFHLIASWYELQAKRPLEPNARWQ